ncbi:DUF5677 domain-containing protein [Tenacibaculum finnmarkense]|nr:DUF5677 domain-containing protein [Tenacibaculum finnmarkense]MCD8406251.1 DUF5677 domain-containing protein [Tenacibaculum dicentrarchi]MCD8425976.1 DUF5677 domain-containing protein [Tenacibaculum dicentrarchi]MCD8440948.1 DUF5677 domain-containing protein [Tenacibaculum finnmarkense genomovar ulcerans]MCD8443255.1 DUF5677 domain-containing protein [Tenacibaculum dicentrarchi]MCG8721868.1 hypothetical protein [Tenacibaculum finnmarkense]
MNEITEIFNKYSNIDLSEFSKTEIELNEFIIKFSKDLGELIDLLSRVINHETHPNYYNLNESTIVGSITRIVKFYQEYIKYQELNKQEIQSLFMRPMYESFIITKYLIKNGTESQENFRLVSYRARYQNFKKLMEFDNKEHPIIKRQLIKLETKLNVDGFTMDDLESENNKPYNKKWKLDGKSFRAINSEVDNDDLYSFIYGVGSDAVHGNWQEIIDFHLTRKENGYFGFLNYEKCDCRVIVPMNSIVIESLLEFMNWNKCLTKEIENGLTKMNKFSNSFYTIWEEKFGETLK